MSEEITNQIRNGVIEDPRTPEEKAKDYQHEELFAFAPAPKWEQRPPKKYPIFNQDGSGSCVSFATAKILGIDEVAEGREFKHLSPRFIYTKRANAPYEGMYLPNALAIATKYGSPLEELVPSEGRNEAGMNIIEDITPETSRQALNFRASGYLELKLDIDTIAGILSQGKAVLLGTRFDYDEWTTYPTVNPNSKQTYGHGIAIVDNILINGKKYLVIDDSWGANTAQEGQRFIDEEWLAKRCFYAGYTLNLINQDQTQADVTKPHYTFTKWLKRGDKDPDVAALQNILKYEGMFPIDVDSTGLYGAVTQKGVLLFQQKYLSTNNGGKQVGPQTMAKLNELYSK